MRGVRLWKTIMCCVKGEKLHFVLPGGWKVLSAREIPPVSGVADPVAEIRRAMDNPIGSPPLEELARPGMEVALLFDDLQRPTPVNLVIPEMLDRLNRAGIPDDRVWAVCALGPTPSIPGKSLKKSRSKGCGAPQRAPRFP